MFAGLQQYALNVKQKTEAIDPPQDIQQVYRSPPPPIPIIPTQYWEIFTFLRLWLIIQFLEEKSTGLKPIPLVEYEAYTPQVSQTNVLYFYFYPLFLSLSSPIRYF